MAFSKVSIIIRMLKSCLLCIQTNTYYVTLAFLMDGLCACHLQWAPSFIMWTSPSYLTGRVPLRAHFVMKGAWLSTGLCFTDEVVCWRNVLGWRVLRRAPGSAIGLSICIGQSRMYRFPLLVDGRDPMTSTSILFSGNPVSTDWGGVIAVGLRFLKMLQTTQIWRN